MNRHVAMMALLLLAPLIRLHAQDGVDPGASVRMSPLTVQEAIRLALARAPEVSAAQAQSQRADEALRETRSSNLPQVVTGTGLAYNNGFPLSIEGSAPSIFQIGMSQSVLSKTNKNLILEAEESSRASRFAAESARNELAARIALLYYDLHRAREMSAINEQRLLSVRKDREIAQALVDAGKARPLELTLSKASELRSEHEWMVARERVRLAETQLKQWIDWDAGRSIETVEPQLDASVLGLSTESLFERALEIHPELRQAEANLRAREFHMEAEKGVRLPKLQVIGEYALFSRTNNYQDFFSRFTRHNFLLGMSIQVPLFDGHRASARVAQSRQEVKEADMQVERLRNEIRLGIERGASGLRIARGSLALAQAELTAAEEELRVSEALHEAGRVGGKDLELSRTRIRSRELEVAQARSELYAKQVDLLRITGTFATLF